MAKLRMRRLALLLAHGTDQNGKPALPLERGFVGYDQRQWAEQLGIPASLECAKERLRECLPHSDALEWPERFLAAISPGADLSGVPVYFFCWLLTDRIGGVIRYAGDRHAELIRTVNSLYERIAGHDVPQDSELDEIDARVRHAIGREDSVRIKAALDVAWWAIEGARGGDVRYLAEAIVAATRATKLALAGETLTSLSQRHANKLIELIELSPLA